MSPELIDPERFGSVGGRPTEESDRYALGMVIYEVLKASRVPRQYMGDVGTLLGNPTK